MSSAAPDPPPEDRTPRLIETAALFLRLGLTSFGGPAAHNALIEQEVVQRRGWLTRERFLDLLAAASLVPGPTSTELAIHIGFTRAGVPGLFAAGLCFLMPAALLTTAFAWAYLRYGTIPQVQAALYGIKPAVLAIVFAAVWRLGRTTARAPILTVAAASAVASLLGAGELVVLMASGAAAMVARKLGIRAAMGALAVPWIAAASPAAAAGAAAGGGPTLAGLAAVFLKIGSLLFGSGYVLIAFLQGELVEQRGWITSQQLLDAVAVGQFTPGPVTSSAAFIGWLLAGPAGAAVSTAAIFAPSFLFVLVSNPLLARLRRSPAAGAFLDGVAAGSLGLMAAAAAILARGALQGPVAWGIAAASGLAVLRKPALNSAWLVMGGALAGLLAGAGR